MQTPLIQCENICKTYHLGEQQLQALRDVSFSLDHGEIVALKGPSGSGKSTLLHICGLLDQADSGQYRLLLDGSDQTEDLAQSPTLIRRQHIGFIFQDFGLMPVLSAYDNVEYPLLLAGNNAATRKQCVNDILHAVGLTGFEHHLPDQLSGGQKQRVAIARALVKKPALVIADEPTANLDSHTAEQIMQLMRALAHDTGTSFLIATHDDRMADFVDRCLILHDGEML